MTTPTTAPTPLPADLRADAERLARAFHSDENAPVGMLRFGGIVADLAAHIERLDAENQELRALLARLAGGTARLAHGIELIAGMTDERLARLESTAGLASP